MSTPNRRKKRLVIERHFQYRLTLKICFAAAGIFLIFGGILMFLVKMNYEMLVQNALLQMPEMVTQLQREFRLISLALVTSFIIMVGIMFGLGLLLSQKLAGPIFALRRQLKEFADGKTGIRLSLRTGDEFMPLADTFNSAMESWEQRQTQHQDALKAALTAIDAGKTSEAQRHIKNALK